MAKESNLDPTVSHVVDIVIRLLAEERREPEVETRAWLEEASPEMPLDSLLIIEILAQVEEKCGVRIPADADAARSMRSVRAFAETVVAVAGQVSGERGGDGGVEG